MCVHWYFAEHSSELSYRLFSKSKGRILDDELRYSFNIKRVWHFPQIFLILSSCSQLPWSNYAKVRKKTWNVEKRKTEKKIIKQIILICNVNCVPAGWWIGTNSCQCIHTLPAALEQNSGKIWKNLYERIHF